MANPQCGEFIYLNDISIECHLEPGHDGDHWDREIDMSWGKGRK
jgi:hypothetical protein